MYKSIYYLHFLHQFFTPETMLFLCSRECGRRSPIYCSLCPPLHCMWRLSQGNQWAQPVQPVPIKVVETSCLLITAVWATLSFSMHYHCWPYNTQTPSSIPTPFPVIHWDSLVDSNIKITWFWVILPAHAVIVVWNWHPRVITQLPLSTYHQSRACCKAIWLPLSSRLARIGQKLCQGRGVLLYKHFTIETPQCLALAVVWLPCLLSVYGVEKQGNISLEIPSLNERTS